VGKNLSPFWGIFIDNNRLPVKQGLKHFEAAAVGAPHRVEVGLPVKQGLKRREHKPQSGD